MADVQKVRGIGASWIVPTARLYVRYSPISFLRRFLYWDRLNFASHEYSVRTRAGVSMAGESRDFVQGCIYYFGIWEPNLTAFVTRRLNDQTGRTFVDVGANVGYYSLLAAKLMPRGNVVAIEAFPSIYARLQQNVELNRFTNIRTVPFAAMESESEVEMFYAGSENEGSTTVVPGKYSATPIRVKGMPLSELLTEAEIRSTRLVKIDVEGAEDAVIQGMRAVLPMFEPDAELVIEIKPAAIGDANTRSMFDLFDAAGYMPYALTNDYSPSSYLMPGPIARPGRLLSLPSEQTDVVFSRVNADYL